MYNIIFNGNDREAFYMFSKVENTFALKTKGTSHPQDDSLYGKTTIEYDTNYLRHTKLIQFLTDTTSITTTAMIDLCYDVG